MKEGYHVEQGEEGIEAGLVFRLVDVRHHLSSEQSTLGSPLSNFCVNVVFFRGNPPCFSVFQAFRKISASKLGLSFDLSTCAITCPER
jgi:hypothetical protein